MPSTTYLPPPSHPMPCPTYSQSIMNPLYQSSISPPLTPAVSPSSMILGSDQFKRKYSVDIGPFGFGTSLSDSIQDQDAFRRSSCSAMSMNGCTGESQTGNYGSVDSRGQHYNQFFGSNLQNTSFYTSSPLSESTESDTSSSQSGKRGSRSTPPAAQHKHACKYPFCNWSFKRYEHLKRHMLVHTGKKPHVCHFPGCGKSFSRSDNFNAHYLYQPESQPKKTNQKTHICPMLQCQRSFKRLEHLKRHMRIHTLERPFGCTFPGCQKAFSRSDNLSQHMKTHQKGEDRRRKQKRSGSLNWAS
ncbi:hypothetical protein K501DRAFT_222797 [Backusella circina FSU 941]|nr:hypothetical protein K501DRAFT_222797 [Backusella circina FSU 941]